MPQGFQRFDKISLEIEEWIMQVFQVMNRKSTVEVFFTDGTKRVYSKKIFENLVDSGVIQIVDPPKASYTPCPYPDTSHNAPKTFAGWCWREIKSWFKTLWW